jgi:hypothetical protein
MSGQLLDNTLQEFKRTYKFVNILTIRYLCHYAIKSSGIIGFGRMANVPEADDAG